jgi:voltage-dependent calcium channel L type alpha-1D
MPSGLKEALEITNHVFTGIFTLEAILKLISYGTFYFRKGWNIFDICILVGIYIQIVSSNLVDSAFITHITILRIFRIARILRLIKKAKSLQSILNTLIITIPSLANIGFLLFLLLIFYSILGVNLFGKVKINGELNSYANFQTFDNAFLTLLRCATGEQWNDIM